MATGCWSPVRIFRCSGCVPRAGRLFGPQDDTPIGQNFVTVLSYGLWQSQFGGNPAIIGTQIVVNGKSMTVLGVAPPGFEGTTLGTSPKVFVPLSMYGEDGDRLRRHGLRTGSHYYWVYLFARLKPGVSMAQANAAINAVYSPIIGTSRCRSRRA